jgi:hypothetical protein
VLLDHVLDRGDAPVEEGGVVEEAADERGVVVPDLHAVQGLLDGCPVGPAHGQGRQGTGVALAAGDGLQDDAGGLGPGQRVHGRGQLDEGALQELLQPLPFPRAVPDHLQAGAGQVPQGPDLRRRHERGAQQAHLGQPGDPLGVQPVGLRPPGQLPGMGRVDQLDVQALGLQ